MKYLLLLVLGFVISIAANAQFTVRVIVTEVATQKGDDLYIAGDFNKWNPGDYNFKMKVFGPTRKLYVFKDIPAGEFAFKITRGSWEKVETAANGSDLENHVIEVSGDTSVAYSIAGWKDNFPDKPKPNTASANVQVLDTAFLMPQLNCSRKIWVYLPASYTALKGKTYPVIYMQDAQNLFNEQTAAFGEWGVDECLDSLQKQLNKEYIIVGIDNGGEKRTNEYNPYDNEKYGKGEGSAYVDFIVQTLKPFIDKRFRTQKDVAHTTVAGSSMGGLIAFYAVIKYPDVFGSAGVFSPSLWLAPRIFEDVQKTVFKTNHQFFLYAGGKESDDMIPDLRHLENLLKANKLNEITTIEAPLGQHNEKYWRMYFDDFYRALKF